MSSPYVSSTQVASSVPYDNSVSGLGTGDTQSAIDALKTQTQLGSAGFSTSIATTTSTNSTTYAQLNSMTLTPTISGNWAVVFTGQFNASSGDVAVCVFSNGVQQTASERICAGQSGGSHNFIVSTSEKVNVTAGQVIEIQWRSGSGGTFTCTGRNMTIIKVQ